MKAQVNEQLSSNELRQLGYRLSVQESGYISAEFVCSVNNNTV